MFEKRKIELCRHRLEKASDCLKSAELLTKSGDYTSAANRSYYAMFHALRAIMAFDGDERKNTSVWLRILRMIYLHNKI